MIIWLIVFIIMGLLELSTVSLISIWFAIGSIFAGISSYFTDSIVIQFIIFLSTSIISLVYTRPLLKKLLPKFTPTNLDSIIGKIGKVTKDIIPDEDGEVIIENKIWTAKSNNTILSGTKVKIISIEGVKLIVENI